MQQHEVLTSTVSYIANIKQQELLRFQQQLSSQIAHYRSLGLNFRLEVCHYFSAISFTYEIDHKASEELKQFLSNSVFLAAISLDCVSDRET